MKFTSRENKLFYLLSKLNVVSIDNIRNYCKAANKSISMKRLRELEKNKFIKKITIVDTNLEETISYQLDKKGIKEAKNQGLNIYKSNSIIHDFKHSNFIFDKFELEDLKYYKHEKELPEPINGASRTDGAFAYPDARVILVETYTRNYTDFMKKSKQAYCEQLGVEIFINR